MARLGCLFILIPLVELWLLLRVGQWLGVLPTVALVAVTGAVGAWLVRTEGVRTMARFQGALARGELPGRILMDGAAILLGGAFLLTPGILTDLAGLALLLRPTRRLLQGWATARLARGLRSGAIHVTSTRFGWGTGFPGTGAAPHPPSDRATGPGKSGDGEDRDDKPPPRPGEIIQ